VPGFAEVGAFSLIATIVMTRASSMIPAATRAREKPVARVWW
jgi:hypothetical protein